MDIQFIGIFHTSDFTVWTDDDVRPSDDIADGVLEIDIIALYGLKPDITLDL